MLLFFAIPARGFRTCWRYLTIALVMAPGTTVEGGTAGMIARFPVLAIIAAWKYVIIIGVYHAIDYRRRYHARELRVAQIESQLAQARVSALRMQIRPHFLFNALNSVAALMLSDPARAHELLAQIGDLLRQSLQSEDGAEVTLEREVDFLDRYLRIERVRFEERLAVHFDIPEALGGSAVPSLILQPLVENAIHHAFAPHTGTRNLTVRARAGDGTLHLEVEDDGPGLPAGWSFERNARTGLRNVQERVNLANPTPQPIDFGAAPRRGLRVRITLPRRDAPPA